MSSSLEPAFLITYGNSGHRKTTDCIYAFPNALFVAAKGALSPWDQHVGLPYMPAHVTNCRTIPQTTELLQKEGSGGKWPALIIDDFSLKADATFADADAHFPKTGSGVQDLWAWIRKVLMEFRDVAREAGIHVIMNCHIRNSHQHRTKGYVLGGPMLPGTMPEDMPKACDCVLRVQLEEALLGWPFLYTADETSSVFIEKDRYGVVPITTKSAPMNLGELLRRRFGSEGPLGIQRPKGLEWMEKAVRSVAKGLAGVPFGTPEHRQVLMDYKAAIQAKYTADERLLFWVLRDGRDRAILDAEHAKGRLLGLFGDSKKD